MSDSLYYTEVTAPRGVRRRQKHETGKDADTVTNNVPTGVYAAYKS